MAIVGLLLGLLLPPFPLGYEAGIYLFQLRSVFADFDLNIINQLPDSMRYFATPTGYATFPHAEIQIIGMMMLYPLEWIVKSFWELLGGLWSYDFKYILTSFLANIIGVIGFFKVTEKVAAQLDITLDKKIYALFFFLGTPLFYFSIFQVHIPEIFSLPFLAFVTLNLILVLNKKSIIHPLVLGLSIGVLMISKVTYFPFIALFVLIYFRHLQIVKSKSDFVVPISAIVLFLLHLLNNYFRYDEWVLLRPPLDIFIYLNFENILTNLFYSTIGPGGVFFNSPILALGFVGFVLWLKAENKLLIYEKLLFLFWFFFLFLSQTLLAGFHVEDHFPGRLSMSMISFFAIGFYYILNLLSAHKKTLMLILLVSVFWNIAVTYNYLVGIQSSVFEMTKSFGFNLILWTENTSKYFNVISNNFSNLGPLLGGVMIWIVLLFVVFSLVILKIKNSFLLKYSGLAFIFVYIGVTFCNYDYGTRNVEIYRARHFYNNLSIVKGFESSWIEFIAHYVKISENRTSGHIKEKLHSSFADLSERVKNKSIRLTPEYENALTNRDLDFYLWNRLENEKKHH